jgi:hypothetical protein
VQQVRAVWKLTQLIVDPDERVVPEPGGALYGYAVVGLAQGLSELVECGGNRQPEEQAERP